MNELCHVVLGLQFHAKGAEQFLVARFLVQPARFHQTVAAEETVAIEFLHKVAALRECPNAIQTDRVETFKNVTLISMLGQPTLFADKSLDFLKSCDDSLLLRRAPSCLRCLGLHSEFAE